MTDKRCVLGSFCISWNNHAVLESSDRDTTKLSYILKDVLALKLWVVSILNGLSETSLFGDTGKLVLLEPLGLILMNFWFGLIVVEFLCITWDG